MEIVRLLVNSGILMFLYLVMGCTSGNQDVSVINGSGLPEAGVSYSRMIFANEKEGYLFGENYGEVTWSEDREATRIDTAIVYVTVDGGLTWRREKLDVGMITNVHQSGEDVYAFKYNGTNRGGRSVVYHTNKLAGRWEVIAELDGYVRDANFSDPNYWIITKKSKSGDFKMYSSTDKGATWQIVLDDFIFQPLFDSNRIYFLTTSNSGVYDTLSMVERVKGGIRKEALPSLFHASLLRIYGNTLFLAGVEGQNLVIYKRENVNKYRLVDKFSLGGETFPKELKVEKNKMVLLAGVKREMYVENHLFRSIDAGKNWVEEKLYKPLYASPIAFYSGSKCELKTWIYSGSGTIQVFK